MNRFTVILTSAALLAPTMASAHHYQEKARKRIQRNSEPVEYQLIYRYNGRIYSEQMDYNPGEWVKLNVEASPA